MVDKSGKWSDPVVTTLEPYTQFYAAEEYHQDYLKKNPGGYTCHQEYFTTYWFMVLMWYTPVCMDNDLRTILEENNQLLKEVNKRTLENRKKINKIHAIIRRGFIARVLYWIVIIAITVGAYLAIQPWVANLFGQYQGIVDQLNQTNSAIQNPRGLLESWLSNSGGE